MSEEYLGKCGEPDCRCVALLGFRHQEAAHEEHLFFKSLDDIALYLIDEGAPYKRQGLSEDYAGMLEMIWDRMCELRGRTPEKFNAQTKEERYLRLASTGTSKRRKSIPASVRLEVYGRDCYECVSCGDHSELTLDHIVPLARGGGNEIENLQTMCLTCNMRKGVKPWRSSGSPSNPINNSPSSRTNGRETSV